MIFFDLTKYELCWNPQCNREHGSTIDGVVDNRDKYLHIKVSIAAPDTDETLASCMLPQSRFTDEAIGGSIDTNEHQIRQVSSLCTAKMVDIISRRLFEKFRQDMKDGSTSRSQRIAINEKSEIAESSLSSFLLDPVVVGVEERENSEYRLEIGLTEKLSLIISLERQDGVKNCVSNDRDLTKVLQIALVDAELKLRTFMHVKKAQMDTESRGLSVTADTTISSLESLNGSIVASPETWAQFVELGGFRRGNIKKTND